MRSSNVFFGWLGVVRVRQETRKKLGWALGHMGNRSLGSSFGQWVWLWKHARQRRQWEQLGLPGAAMALLYEAQGIAPSAAVAAAAAMERPPPQRQQQTVGMGRKMTRRVLWSREGIIVLRSMQGELTLHYKVWQ